MSSNAGIENNIQLECMRCMQSADREAASKIYEKIEMQISHLWSNNKWKLSEHVVLAVKILPFKKSNRFFIQQVYLK